MCLAKDRFFAAFAFISACVTVLCFFPALQVQLLHPGKQLRVKSGNHSLLLPGDFYMPLPCSEGATETQRMRNLSSICSL